MSTIIFVIVTIILTGWAVAQLFHVVDCMEKKMAPHWSKIILAVLVMLLLFTRADAITWEISEFNHGYEDAIRSCILVHVDREGYILSFNGETHEYTWEEETEEHLFSQNYEGGYERAVFYAYLWDVTQDGYYIDFEGELHFYSF